MVDVEHDENILCKHNNVFCISDASLPLWFILNCMFAPAIRCSNDLTEHSMVNTSGDLTTFINMFLSAVLNYTILRSLL